MAVLLHFPVRVELKSPVHVNISSQNILPFRSDPAIVLEMGRRPNQLILEFFERGPKLEDASNRYQHTCKTCGEKFPKGRIDSLTTHLVKKCQAIRLRDRQRALLQLHELPDFADGDSSGKEGGGGVVEKGRRVELPFAGNLTGLEALAEASRQIEKRVSPPRESIPAQNTVDDSAIDPSLRDPKPIPLTNSSDGEEPLENNGSQSLASLSSDLKLTTILSD